MTSGFRQSRYRRIYCRKFLTLSNHTSRYICKCIRIVICLLLNIIRLLVAPISIQLITFQYNKSLACKYQNRTVIQLLWSVAFLNLKIQLLSYLTLPNGQFHVKGIVYYNRRPTSVLRMSFIIMQTCPCNVHPLTLHFYIVKLGFKGYTLFFLIFSLKHRLWVLVRTASLRRF